VPIAWRVALAYIAIGLVKKLLIADTLAPHVDVLFDLSQHDSVTAWHSVYAMLMYGLYIYFDFSGFCDIALGLGLLFGVRLPKNFISPYQARNIRQFWRTWHITLSQFFSTYIYQPLGGNRHGLVLTLSLVLLVFGLSGLWHGANYTFIVWGACHGLMLCVLITYEKLALPALPRLLGRSVTLLGVFLAWVYFRADSLEDAHILLNGLANLQSYTLANLIALQVNTGMAVLHFGLACAVLLWWVLTAPCSHVWTRYIARASAQGTSMTVSILTHPYLVGIAVFTLFKLTAFSPAPDFIYVNF
jgi:D-alanyl-lipoteichoic acid acyltransferase DltB (MBOAT superfamily)